MQYAGQEQITLQNPKIFAHIFANGILNIES
jgi:hypothetical protein